MLHITAQTGIPALLYSSSYTRGINSSYVGSVVMVIVAAVVTLSSVVGFVRSELESLKLRGKDMRVLPREAELQLSHLDILT